MHLAYRCTVARTLWPGSTGWRQAVELLEIAALRLLYWLPGIGARRLLVWLWHFASKDRCDERSKNNAWIVLTQRKRSALGGTDGISRTVQPKLAAVPSIELCRVQIVARICSVFRSKK